jgi:UDP-N-acetylmuramoyl-L-alanyl-D-glutamate--2,6-diaminopimelate ligase
MYYIVGGRETPAPNTTPESCTVQELLAQMADEKITHAVMEVSSHSLEQHRVEDVEFAAGVFTNLTPEHLDYHKTMRAYACAKAKLFKALPADAPAAVNADDRWCDKVTRVKRRNRFRYAIRREAEVKVTGLDVSARGSRFTVASPWGTFEIRTVLPARHNVYNCLAAATVTAALGIDPEDVAEGIARVTCVRGRLEPVAAGQDFTVLVDYAHTTAALESVLKAVRELTKTRLIVLFGCGGDRDKSKRPRMRAAAEKIADRVVVTSDNPRTENPLAIIDRIMKGVRDRSKFTIEPDRRAAIAKAIGMARPGDVVLLAGKGHEDYQIIGDRRFHLDDREEALKALKALKASGRMTG